MLAERARAVGLEGAEVSLAWVPQARAVRVGGGSPAADPLLLELYLENERRSGGGPLEGLRRLPGTLGTVASFQQWQGEWGWVDRAHPSLCLGALTPSVLSLPPSG